MKKDNNISISFFLSNEFSQKKYKSLSKFNSISEPLYRIENFFSYFQIISYAYIEKLFLTRKQLEFSLLINKFENSIEILNQNPEDYKALIEFNSDEAAKKLLNSILNLFDNEKSMEKRFKTLIKKKKNYESLFSFILFVNVLVYITKMRQIETNKKIIGKLKNIIKLLKDFSDENNNDTLDLHLQRFLLMIMAKCLDININIYDSEKNHEFFIVNQEEKHNEINLFHESKSKIRILMDYEIHKYYEINYITIKCLEEKNEIIKELKLEEDKKVEKDKQKIILKSQIEKLISTNENLIEGMINIKNKKNDLFKSNLIIENLSKINANEENTNKRIKSIKEEIIEIQNNLNLARDLESENNKLKEEIKNENEEEIIKENEKINE